MAIENDGHDTSPDLDALFAEARRDGPRPDLVARVLTDAATTQGGTAQGVTVARGPAAPRRGWLSDLVAGLGGWSAVSGITAAGVVGLAVGFYSPDAITGWIGEGTLPFTATGFDVTPDIGGLWAENGDV